MLERLLLLAFVFVAMVAMPAGAQAPRVTLTTSLGKIVLELDPAKAPKSVESFLAYVDSGFYDGTIFHRVIPGFMIQAGGHTANMQRKTTREPVVNESKNGLSNQRGTVAMARTADPDSATSQFFINSVDNSNGLDSGKTGDGVGYTVFGKVVEGMDVVDKISAVKTTTVAGSRDVPVEAVVIQSAKRDPAPAG
jgi:cyclophilin family peptidyl-prolyl cis-trans isomerase